jgi:hypothetical protein
LMYAVHTATARAVPPSAAPAGPDWVPTEPITIGVFGVEQRLCAIPPSPGPVPPPSVDPVRPLPGGVVSPAEVRPPAAGAPTPAGGVSALPERVGPLPLGAVAVPPEVDAPPRVSRAAAPSRPPSSSVAGAAGPVSGAPAIAGPDATDTALLPRASSSSRSWDSRVPQALASRAASNSTTVPAPLRSPLPRATLRPTSSPGLRLTLVDEQDGPERTTSSRSVPSPHKHSTATSAPARPAQVASGRHLA